jgi:hypothetical protein
MINIEDYSLKVILIYMRGSDKYLSLILRSGYWSYIYARDVIRGRWEAGERIIASNAHISCAYARDVIRGRWEKGESEIARDSLASYYYARDVIRGRFYLGEVNIKGKDISLEYEQYFRCRL